MYYPYFRGKQYELITVRESASLLAGAGFVPIIEPVKESLAGLKRTLDAVNEADGAAILVVNPQYGDHIGNSEAIRALLNEQEDRHNIAAGILLSDQVKVADCFAMCDEYPGRAITLIHAGFTEARALVEHLGQQRVVDFRHIFLEDSCGKLYRKHFEGGNRVLLRDGFQRRVNKHHPDVEFFSDLHATYGEENMDGFGDFLIVGDVYSETGGPAYAIAIHLTFIDPDKDDEMHIYHFKSDRQDTPTDPAGKFVEALNKLVAEVERPGSHITRTEAVEEFVDLHERRHFPGLGYVKKLSMKHHIETLDKYYNGQQ